MLDHIILAPYYLALKIRHALYDSGIRKVRTPEIPTVSIGNVTVGGTGKTPHTEMILRLLKEHPVWGSRHLAVLSRGYRRKSRGFQQVDAGKEQGRHSPAAAYGDEPVQIKRKFPDMTVAVDKNRIEGCDFLAHPDKVKTSKKGRKCLHKDFPAADIVVLDDAFQYRTLKPSVSIVLVSHDRPVHSDHLLPAGRLRDLPERLSKADILIVTKCPYYMEDEERREWAKNLGIKNYNLETCSGTDASGRRQHLFFTTVRYDALSAVFPEGDPRYVYSKQAVLFSGIADDSPLLRYLSDTYKVVRHLTFGDHHEFTTGDMSSIRKAAEDYPTSVTVTTEKDSQRLADFRYMPAMLKERMFFAPIKADFLSEKERTCFMQALESFI